MTEHSDIHPLLRKRWSPKRFHSNPIPDADLKLMFEAARWSPSSFNEQPWRFILTRKGTEAFDRLSNCLSTGNQQWAPHAPVMILALSKPTFNHKGRDNRHSRYDLGQAIAHLTFQATELGYQVHQMAGFSVSQAEEAFDIPKAYEAVTVFTIGRQREDTPGADDVPERDKSKRSRLSLDEVVFEEAWQQPADLNKS
jgi:nitroreductase